MISSLSNPKAKNVRRLQVDRRYRARQQQFIVEGSRWITELTKDSSLQETLFYTENWLSQEEHANLIASYKGNKHLIAPEVMAGMSSTETPPGVLAVVPIKSLSIPLEPTLILILDSITNPGNMGTLLRTAAAAAVDVVFLTPGSVDIYNPKVVRGSMGAILRLPVYQNSWDEILQKTRGMDLWVAAAAGKLSYTEVEWTRPSALIIGNEARGASEKAFVLANGAVSIPMSAETESLNAAVAAGIVLFEAARQRNLIGE